MKVKIELKRIQFPKKENIKTVLFAVVAVATAASYGRKQSIGHVSYIFSTTNNI